MKVGTLQGYLNGGGNKKHKTKQEEKRRKEGANKEKQSIEGLFVGQVGLGEEKEMKNGTGVFIL